MCHTQAGTPATETTTMNAKTKAAKDGKKLATKIRGSRARRLAAAEAAAAKHLGLETLETRKRDSLDFHEIPVWAIREVIEFAFDAGYQAAFDAAEAMRI